MTDTIDAQASLDRAPAGAVASFAGVGNPHLRSNLQPGETVLDLGSGAGLDSIIAAWQVGPTGRVIGLDLNPAMRLKGHPHAAAGGARMECQVGRMEDIPLPSGLGGRGPLQRRHQLLVRAVPALRGDRVHARALGSGAALSLPQGVHAELGRGIRRESGDDDRAQAGCRVGGAAPDRRPARRAQRLADLAIPSAPMSAARASAISGWISGSGVRTVSLNTCQWRLASSMRPMRA